MTIVRVAGHNVENLFARPRAFGPMSEAAGDAAVQAHADFNRVIAKADYSDADRRDMRELLTTLGIYVMNAHGALRRSASP
ncbi:MAG TPA: hypothetical protein VMM13_00235 [Euzebya sp.]|nr:hypothetical protein [Euzebya sp.]